MQFNGALNCGTNLSLADLQLVSPDLIFSEPRVPPTPKRGNGMLPLEFVPAQQFNATSERQNAQTDSATTRSGENMCTSSIYMSLLNSALEIEQNLHLILLRLLTGPTSWPRSLHESLL